MSVSIRRLSTSLCGRISTAVLREEEAMSRTMTVVALLVMLTGLSAAENEAVFPSDGFLLHQDSTTNVETGSVRIVVEATKWQTAIHLWIINDSDKWVAIGVAKVCPRQRVCSRWPSDRDGSTSFRTGRCSRPYFIEPRGKQRWRLSREVWRGPRDSPPQHASGYIEWSVRSTTPTDRTGPVGGC